MMDFYDIVIAGCGLSGATSARLLAEQGYKVLVIEQKKHVGGQIYDYKNEHGISVHQYGPHIFHTKLKPVWDFVNRFSEFSNFQHRVLSFVDGNFIPFPINRQTLNQLFGENLTTEDVPVFLQKEVQRSEYNPALISFRDAVVSQVGERLYALFFEKYTEKQWNCDPNSLSSELAGRIPVRNNNDCRYFSDKYQGIPVNGYTEMINKMLEHGNIHVLLGCDYENIKSQLSAKLLIYTGELDRFFNYRFGKLSYRSVKIAFKTYEQELFQPAPVVNYPNDYDYTRITEFKQMTREKSTKTTVCYEYPSDDGLPFYTVPNKENQHLREQYMQEVQQLEMTGKYLFIGRLAEYKYYNMDVAIESAIKRVAQWLKH
ncbi:MAG: UDP-galactopyranose mutase [Bacteroidales bacterium]|jgi:UDP-galactopyranose mutase|nr:UDP-galactopyranose mutase [Bacteroidales bacterium]